MACNGLRMQYGSRFSPFLLLYMSYMNLYLSNENKMLLVVYFVIKAVFFFYKSDCAAFGTAVEQIRRVCDDKTRIIFVNSP